ncbi:hypothetical protein BN136_526 [Cronobacter universalis NCTC 9529]|nr:hypothetical protein BN136_526 [Cronobacter universalis NCTC 9529]
MARLIVLKMLTNSPCGRFLKQTIQNVRKSVDGTGASP